MTTKRTIAYTLGFILAGLVLVYGQGFITATQTETVTRVYDGDTVEMKDGEVIRVDGIDTPEKDECGYKRAKQWVIDNIKGQAVILHRDGKGKYGRTIAKIEYTGGDVGEYMVKNGLAYNWDEYNKAERYAQKHDKGIWKHCYGTNRNS